MAQQYPLEVLGAPASPYTRKLVAALRYRQIPHRVLWGDAASHLQSRDLPPPKVALLPTLLLPDGEHTEVLVDTTPIISHLDTLYTRRRLRPAYDPALAFIDALIEDYADEWCTKIMFHYRWHFADDEQFSATTLPLMMAPALSASEAEKLGAQFAQRQKGRLRYVGSNPTTAPFIEASFLSLLEILNQLLEEQRFCLGDRPGAGDFALYGQLTQLALYDPTPRLITAQYSPRTVAWTASLEDLSGLHVTPTLWRTLDTLPAGTHSLMSEIGRVYVPLLLANAAAADAGQPRFDAEIDGAPWTQDTFPYQVRCLAALRDRFSALQPQEQTAVHEFLAGSGCEPLLPD